MTAHNLSVQDCWAVIDRAYSCTFHYPFGLLLTLTTTDIPGRSTRSASETASSTTFTGTRWTTLTKFPDAFSAGNKLNLAPVAAEILSTCPLNAEPPYASTWISA